jgi:hypothetical protein
MTRSALAVLAAQHRRDGFDRTIVDRARGTITVSCSQCAALVINGTACHEHGCPNQKKKERTP